MGLLKTVKEMVIDSIMENREAEYRILKKTFQYNADKLYQYLTSRGIVDDFMEDIMSDDDDETRELHRMVIRSFITAGDDERLYKYTTPAFHDIEMVDDKIVLVLDEKADLSQFFYQDRDVSMEGIASILNGDHDSYGGYWEDVDSRTFEYIIDDLSESNLNYLKELVKSTVLGRQSTYNGDNGHLEDIIESDKGMITKDALDEVFRNNSNLSDFIFNTDDLENLKTNLERIYNYASENAINDENYDNVMSAIEDFFGDKGEEFNTGRKNTYRRKDGTTYQTDSFDYRITVTSLYKDIIDWWADQDYHDLDYWGSFEEALKEYCGDLSYGDSMTFRWSEYPDGSKVKEIINEIFLDYIEE